MSKRKSERNIVAKENIVSALLQLIYIEPFSSITISELTKKAGVSRMTFYRNYDSIEDIFSKELEDIFSKYEMNNSVSGVYYDKCRMEYCFEYLFSYKELVQGLVHCGFGDMFLKRMTKCICERWNNTTCTGLDYKLVGFAGFVYNIYIVWMENDYKNSAQEMAEYIYSVFSLTA